MATALRLILVLDSRQPSDPRCPCGGSGSLSCSARYQFSHCDSRRGEIVAIFAPSSRNKEVNIPAYFIVDVNVQDPAGFEEYRKRVPATIEKYGGKFLVRGGKFEKLEGNWEPTRIVLLEFPSLEQAKRWYDSEEYREPKALRLKTARTNLILVEGAS